VAKALADSTGNDTNAVISTWNSALDSRPSDPAFSALADSESGRARSVSFFRGAAAATIFSLLISFGNLIFSAIVWIRADEETKLRLRWVFWGVAIFDSLLFASGCVCFAFAVMLGPNALTENPADPSGTGVVSFVDIGLFVVMVAFVLRVISVPAIGFIVICLLGFQIIVTAFFIYFMWKGLMKMMSYQYRW
jgi:hypothetical protein